MPQSGIAETILQSLQCLPELLWQPMLANILLVGGNTLIPNFVERVETGVRMLAPEDMIVRVRRAKEYVYPFLRSLSYPSPSPPSFNTGKEIYLTINTVP
jgi:hypothetical protein